MESSGTPNCDSSLAHKAAAKVKSKATKSSKHKQLLDCFDLLPDSAKNALLEQLRGFSSTGASSKKNLDKAESANSESTKDVKACLYDEHMEAERKTREALCYGTKIPSHKLQTGLQITLILRTDRDIGDIKVVLCKHDQGIDPISCKKMQDKVVKSLEPKISTGNISHMLTSVDSAKYNVAADAISWQTILKSIHCFCMQYDMISLLKIPQGVDHSKPHHVAKATQFKDTINNLQDLDDKDFFQWQGFLLCHGTDVEIESDNWLDDVLQISMEPTLRSEVVSDLHGIPLHQRGSMTTIRCIIKHMVVRNQEVRNALETYIRPLTSKCSQEKMYPLPVFASRLLLRPSRISAF
jgi:hypothetical protein